MSNTGIVYDPNNNFGHNSGHTTLAYTSSSSNTITLNPTSDATYQPWRPVEDLERFVYDSMMSEMLYWLGRKAADPEGVRAVENLKHRVQQILDRK